MPEELDPVAAVVIPEEKPKLISTKVGKLPKSNKSRLPRKEKKRQMLASRKLAGTT